VRMNADGLRAAPITKPPLGIHAERRTVRASTCAERSMAGLLIVSDGTKTFRALTTRKSN
jgi:cytidine deaminase